MSATAIPETCKALVWEAKGTFPTVQTIQTPQVQPGSAVVKILVACINDSFKKYFAGKLPFPIVTPLVPGQIAIGRIAATGADSVSLKLGQLVLIEPFRKARDDPTVQILQGYFHLHTPGSEKLMADGWRDSVLAEYGRFPLENCYPLDENVLLASPSDGGLGYDIADLVYLAKQALPYAGFRSIGLQAGETVIVAPATGSFSSTAVESASALGARVIAVGRNLERLEKLAAHFPNVKVAHISGDVEKDTATISQYGKADVYFDFSPPMATQSTHYRSCLALIKPYGRVCLMGFVPADFPLPYAFTMSNNLTIKGRFMYEREDVQGLIKAAELGIIKLGKPAGIQLLGKYTFDTFEEGVNVSADHEQWGFNAVLIP